MATLLALFSSRSFRRRSRLRLLSRFFNAQTDTALAINFQNFHRYFLTHLQVMNDFLNAFVSDFENMWTRPSLPPPMATNAPKSTIRLLYQCRRGPLRFLQ